MPRKTELKVGLYVVITTLLIFASIGYIAYKKGLFETVSTYTLSSKSGEDLTEGMPVTFAGFTIGRVQKLELNESGIVLIKIRVPQRHTKWIRVDSTFIISKPLIGSPRMIIVTDNVKSPPLSTEEIREVMTVNDINETIKKLQPLIERINQIAANIEKMTGNLADPQGDVNKILRSASEITENLASKKSILEMAVGNEESVKSIHGGLKKVKDITEHVDAILKKTDIGVYGPEGLIPQVNGILKDLLAKLDKLNKTVDNINKISTDAADSTTDLKLLRSEIDATVKSIGNLASELDKKIPFKKEPEIKLP
ncbi:MAG: MCE family protein [Deltaproteobacteria bacterium]|nr:MCE family protein [Deltaproteobacteria bacterium]